jgi:hypothetical protein
MMDDGVLNCLKADVEKAKGLLRTNDMADGDVDLMRT